MSKRNDVHVISATAIVVDGKTHHLAMCGEDVGDYHEAAKTHPVGNYTSPTACNWHKVTCESCKTRIENRAR